MNTFSLKVVLSTMILSLHSFSDADVCYPSGNITGVTPPGECNNQNDSKYCMQGNVYSTYTCSPDLSSQNKAVLTLNSFQEGRDGGGPSKCDEKYHSDDSLIVALSTGWYNNGGRCMQNITISGNGQSVIAMVVDECDSTTGCDKEHAYQPPCSDNIVDASNAMWEALGVPRDNWGQLDITWSDA